MVLKSELKDWQIAQIMFGKNTKKECEIVKSLRQNGEIENLCDGWKIIKNKKINDNVGWLIPNECLNMRE